MNYLKELLTIDGIFDREQRQQVNEMRSLTIFNKHDYGIEYAFFHIFDGDLLPFLW